MAVKIYNTLCSNIKIREEGTFTAPELITDAGKFIPEAGGYYAGGNIVVDGKEYAVIIAPKELGQSSSSLQWKTSNTTTTGTFSTYNGKANMQAITNAGLSIHPAAQYCASLNINGFNDWHLPSPDELEICYRYLKPNTSNNYTNSRSLHSATNGTNPNSNPVGSGYKSSNPSRTSVSDFIEGGSQAFDISDYWTSMQYKSTNSWYQHCINGLQNISGNKTASRSCRAVRWLEV